MKGRANYACRQKIYDADREPMLNGLEEIADFQIIRDWEKTTETGDRAEIKTLPESSTAWAKVDARRDLCTGQKCQQFERCFITLMHQRAQESDIIIVNHHLFFADLAVKEVLKDDDSGRHHPRIRRGGFRRSARNRGRGRPVFRRVRQQLPVPGAGARHRRGVARQAVRLGGAGSHSGHARRLRHALFSALPAPEGRVAFTGHAAFLEQQRRDLRNLHSRAGTDRLAPEAGQERARGGRSRCCAARGNWRRRWSSGCESDDRLLRLLGGAPRPRLLSASHAHRCCADAGRAALRCAWIRWCSPRPRWPWQAASTSPKKRLGIEQTRTLVVPSHFEYQKQALLYVPQHLPDPRSPAFTKAAAERSDPIAEAQPRAARSCCSPAISRCA